MPDCGTRIAMPSEQILHEYETNRRRMRKLTREEFLTWLAWSSSVIPAALMGFGSFRFLVPNFTFGPPTMFKIGKPEEFPQGRQIFLPESRLFIASAGAGIGAMSGPALAQCRRPARISAARWRGWSGAFNAPAMVANSIQADAF